MEICCNIKTATFQPKIREAHSVPRLRTAWRQQLKRLKWNALQPQ